MAYTRAQIETLLIARLGDLLAQAELDGATHDGTNADLNDPIGFALRALGYTVANPTAVADADVAGMATVDLDELVDVAELRALETLHGYVLDLVTTTVGPRKEEYGQMAKGLDVKINRRALYLRHVYGHGLPELQAGTLGLQIAQHRQVPDA